jgi:hypothetical protein
MMELEVSMGKITKFINGVLAWMDEVRGKKYPRTELKRKYHMVNSFLKWVKGRKYEKWGDTTFVINLEPHEALVKVVSYKHQLGILRDNPLIRVKINMGDRYFPKDSVIACTVKKITDDVYEGIPLPHQDSKAIAPFRIIWK